MGLSILKTYFCFILGFLAGFLMVIFMNNLLHQDISVIPSHHIHHPVTDNIYYNNWLRKHGVTRVQGDTKTCAKNNKKILESDFLKRYVKITCVIFVTNIDATFRVFSFWVTKCDNFYFFGPNKSEFIPIITSTYSMYPWQRMCKTLEYIILNEEQFFQWIILVNDNTFVIPENLRYSLVLLNETSPFYGGRIRFNRNIFYNGLKTGIVFNKAALETLIQRNNLPCYIQNFMDPEFHLAKMLYHSDIYPKSLLDQKGCNRFHSTTLQDLFTFHLHQKNLEEYDLDMVHLKDQEGICVSTSSITFKMPDVHNYPLETVYEYFLYNLRKLPFCDETKYLKYSTYSLQSWLESMTAYTNASKEEIMAMNPNQFYNLWSKIMQRIPQTW